MTYSQFCFIYFTTFVLNHFSYVRFFVTPWTVALQAPLFMEFSRQEYWSGLPSPPPGDLPDPRVKLMSPASLALQVDSLPLSHWQSPILPPVTPHVILK